MNHKTLLALAVAGVLALSTFSPVRADDAADTPKVFLDKNPRIVAYQLKRLSNAQLVALERKTDHPKDKPVIDPQYLKFKYTIGGTNPSFTFTVNVFSNPLSDR